MMNFIKQIYPRIPRTYVIKTFIKRGFSAKESLIAEQLTKRSLIRVQGKEVVPFLQGLITNDMCHFTRGAHSIYTMFLNNAGRVLNDSIIYRTNDEDTFIIECDKAACSELRRHLRLYRVRRKVEVDSIEAEYNTWVIFKHQKLANDDFAQDPKCNTTKEYADTDNDIEVSIVSNDEIIVSHDPRTKALGIRVIMPKSFSYAELSKKFPNCNLVQSNLNLDYTYLRYTLGIGEGIQDHPPNKCFPLEANCDFLHGVSFQKGCYVGQELTARVYHTGVVRKRLMPIKLTKKVEAGVVNVQSIGGAVLGTIRGVKNDVALALLRVDQIFKTPYLLIDDNPCKPIIPNWWPKELPIKQAIKERVIEST